MILEGDTGVLDGDRGVLDEDIVGSRRGHRGFRSGYRVLVPEET